jgi:hypothetical protein
LNKGPEKVGRVVFETLIQQKIGEKAQTAQKRILGFFDQT